MLCHAYVCKQLNPWAYRYLGGMLHTAVSNAARLVMCRFLMKQRGAPTMFKKLPPAAGEIHLQVSLLAVVVE